MTLLAKAVDIGRKQNEEERIGRQKWRADVLASQIRKCREKLGRMGLEELDIKDEQFEPEDHVPTKLQLRLDKHHALRFTTWHDRVGESWVESISVNLISQCEECGLSREVRIVSAADLYRSLSI